MILAGQQVALSISTAPDMAKLGYPAREVDRTLFGICGALVRAGARIAYGGNIDPHGYTFKIFTFLAKAYAVRQEQAPFVHYLPESVLRQAEFDQLSRFVREGNGIVETRVLLGGNAAAKLLWLDGAPELRLGRSSVRLEGPDDLAAWVRQNAVQDGAGALTAMRELVSAQCSARIAMGGKMGLLADPLDRYGGAMPGVVEESLATLRHGKRLIVLGAFGGAARDIAIALGLLGGDHRVPRGPQMEGYDQAVARLEPFRGGQAGDWPALRELATSDRTERLGRQIVALLGTEPRRETTADPVWQRGEGMADPRAFR